MAFGFIGDIASGIYNAPGKLSHALGIGSGDPSNPYRNGVAGVAGNAAGFAGDARANYNANQQGLNSSIAALQATANGQNSVSAEQLRQGNHQALGAQRSFAASASPQNAAMAARTGAIQMGRLNMGLAGQQAVAGLQERQQAQQAMGQLQLGQSGQNLQGTLGGYGAANQGYGTALGTPQNTWGSYLQKGLAAAGAALAK